MHKYLFLTFIFFISTPIFAQSESFKTVLGFESQKGWVFSLDSVKSDEEAVKAILALYSFQNGVGCENSSGIYQCVISKNIGLAQCSTEHITFLKKWFKSDIPFFNQGMSSGLTKTKEGFSVLTEAACYRAPDTATNQYIWNKIELSKKEKTVTIKSSATWVNAYQNRTFNFFTVFEIEESSVSLKSNTVVENTKK
jgi:hypothetical protein